MAKRAKQTEGQTGSRGTKPPITANPAFPLVVGLWFAALLGIGSLIVPTVLIERVIMALSLPSIVPQMAPPLGITAKSLIALASAVGGGMLGLVLARRLFRRAGADAAGSGTPSPVSPYEDFGDDAIRADGADVDDDESPPPRLGRRRSLAMAEEEGMSEFLETVPLPGSDAPQEAEPAMSETIADTEAETVDLLDLEEATALEPETHFVPANAPSPVGEATPAPRQEFISADPIEPAADDAMADVAKAEEADAAEAAAIPAKATARAPLPFSPPSMARMPEPEFREEAASAEPSPEAVPGTETDDETKFDTDTDTQPSFSEETAMSDHQTFDDSHRFDSAAAEPDTQPDEAENDVAAEGLVSLVQRLGSTLERHREWAAEQAATRVAGTSTVAMDIEAAAAEPGVPEDFGSAAADDAASAMAAFFGAPPRAAEEAVEEAAEEPGQDTASLDGPTEPALQPQDKAPQEPDRHTFAPVSANVGSAVPAYRPFDAEFLAAAASPDADEDEDESDIAASFTLPLKANRVEPAPRPAFDVPPPSAAPEADPPAPAAAANPFASEGQSYPRIDMPEEDDGVQPAVLFPNQKAATSHSAPMRPTASNDENERALREALQNLKRMH